MLSTTVESGRPGQSRRIHAPVGRRRVGTALSRSDASVRTSVVSPARPRVGAARAPRRVLGLHMDTEAGHPAVPEHRDGCGARVEMGRRHAPRGRRQTPNLASVAPRETIGLGLTAWANEIRGAAQPDALCGSADPDEPHAKLRAGVRRQSESGVPGNAAWPHSGIRALLLTARRLSARRSSRRVSWSGPATAGCGLPRSSR